MSAFESIGLIILMAYFAAAVIFPIFWTVVTLHIWSEKWSVLRSSGCVDSTCFNGDSFSGFLDVIFNIFFIGSYALSLYLLYTDMQNARRDGVPNSLGRICFILHASGGGLVFAICVIGIAVAGDI